MAASGPASGGAPVLQPNGHLLAGMAQAARSGPPSCEVVRSTNASAEGFTEGFVTGLQYPPASRTAELP